MPSQLRCSPQGFLAAMQQISNERNELVHELGFGGFLQIACKQLNIGLCMGILQKINVAYCKLQLEEALNIPMTCNHVQLVFGIPSSEKKPILDNHYIREGHAPSIIEIEDLVVETENATKFHCLFIIFVCATLFTPTMGLEGHHALWHALPESLIRDVNWRQFLIDELMHVVHDHRQSGGFYIKGCLLFLQICPYQNSPSYTNFTCQFSCHDEIL